MSGMLNVAEDSRRSTKEEEERMRKMLELLAQQTPKERKLSSFELVMLLVGGLFDDQDSRETILLWMVCVLGIWAMVHSTSKIRKWLSSGTKGSKALGGRPIYMQSALMSDLRDVPETSTLPRNTHHSAESTPVSRTTHSSLSPMSGLAATLTGLKVGERDEESYAQIKKRTSDQLEAMSRFTSRMRANEESFEKFASDLALLP